MTQQVVAPAQISFTIVLQPWVSLAQFDALHQVVMNGLNQYGHMIQSYINNDIPPTNVVFPTQVVFQGVDPAVAQTQIQAAIASALSSIPGFVEVNVEPGQ